MGNNQLKIISEMINGLIEDKERGKGEPIQDDWLSIESAPKDGSVFLGYDEVGEEYYITFWIKTIGNGCWYCPKGGYIAGLTHWQPLPAPPIKTKRRLV